MQVTVATWPSPYPCRRDLPASAVPEEFYFGSIRKPIDEGDDSPQQCRIFCFYFGSIRRQAEEKRLFPLAKRIFFYLGSEEDANDSPWANQVPKVAPAAAGCLHNCTRRRESATPSFLPSGLRGSRTPTGRMIESIFVCGFQLSPERTGEG